jgi:hypothetical protein
MPTESKFGLVIGVGLVILIAVVFFRREAAQSRPSGEPTSAAAVKPPGSLLPPPRPRQADADERGQGQAGTKAEAAAVPAEGVLTRRSVGER